MKLSEAISKNNIAWAGVAILVLVLLYLTYKFVFKGSGYEFFHGKDSDSGDIDYRPDLRDDVAKLMLECNKNKECIAFNTEGYLKSKLNPKSQWKLYMTTKDKGLYVRKSVLKNLN